jgi:hypothetical protein
MVIQLNKKCPAFTESEDSLLYVLIFSHVLCPSYPTLDLMALIVLGEKYKL